MSQGLNRFVFVFNEFSWCDHKLSKDLISTDFCITSHV